MAYKPNMEDIKKLRTMTGAGLADVKKALTEAEGDFDKAKDLLRERGLAIAAKRSDRETSNGCVLVKVDNDFAAIIALKCETDFVANGADFIALTQAVLDAAVANRCKSIEEVANLTLADGQKVADAITQRSGQDESALWHLGMDVECLTGFMSWLEAGPPGEGRYRAMNQSDRN